MEEAKDILKFNEELDKVQAWIREKEMLANAGDMGRDYEHCLELQKKVSDVEGVCGGLTTFLLAGCLFTVRNNNRKLWLTTPESKPSTTWPIV